MSRLAPRARGFGTTVFSEFSALAAKHQAVNLGQGFPDFDGPDEVKQVAIRAIEQGVNQYAMGAGAPALRQAIARHSKRFYGMEVDPDTMVTVTSGATEAIFDAILGLVGEGDEVILFEPYYDSYAASVQLAGGVARYVSLRAPNEAHTAWWFDEGELADAFTARTRLLVLNTPHNPTGKVFTRGELERIAALCVKHDVPVLSDEVYEHLVFAPAEHVRIATLPGMADRTLTLGSGGKSFSFTGWKVGWAIGVPELRAAVQSTHQWVTFAIASPFQAAIAHALELPDGYFREFIASYRSKRDRLAHALREAGFQVFPTEGTYFLVTEIEAPDDYAFCRELTEKTGVAAIPLSSFYARGRERRRYVRFAFCKTDPLLDEGARRLVAARSGR
jgi:N-succinyldiaminopimelate aminotransferase